MEKVDFKKTLPDLYNPKNSDWEEIDVPSLNFLMIDGAGNPNTSKAYAKAVEALYGVAYPLKFMSKRELGRDYVVPPLEGLWYADDPSVFERFDKDSYKWTMMLLVPEWISTEMVEKVVLGAKTKRSELPYEKIRFETYHEGRSLQLLYVGSYDDEAPKLHQLHHKLMPSLGVDFNGHHHEVYLSDPRKSAPEKLRTILRQPIRDAIDDLPSIGGLATSALAEIGVTRASQLREYSEKDLLTLHGIGPKAVRY